MSKTGESILRGARQALRYAKGDLSAGKETRVRVSKSTNVKRLRQQFGLTQAEFAKKFGFTLAAIRDWEQGRRKPRGSARVMLVVIENDPEAVERALAG